MITLEEYLRNPCASLSIPYWKAKGMTIPPQIRIVHDNEFSSDRWTEYEDERYFRLFRGMADISDARPESVVLHTASRDDLPLMADVINRSYTDLSVSLKQLEGYTATPVYEPQLWVLAKDAVTGGCMGCGVADYDPEAGEMILEWIQVLPACRGRGVGQAIVNELLRRAQGYARFATVSGKVDNPTRPERLYRRCGFEGGDVWHILRRK